MSTLWGCVFEDLVSAGRAERNVADDYLKRRGWKESAGTRAYIEASSDGCSAAVVGTARTWCSFRFQRVNRRSKLDHWLRGIPHPLKVRVELCRSSRVADHDQVVILCVLAARAEVC
jgi:hypothetical protein